MSKLTKTVGKWKLWTVVSAIIVAAGIIVAAIFGLYRVGRQNHDRET